MLPYFPALKWLIQHTMTGTLRKGDTFSCAHHGHVGLQFYRKDMREYVLVWIISVHYSYKRTNQGFLMNDESIYMHYLDRKIYSRL